MDNQLSFFDLTDRYSQLSKKGDPLERLDEVIDWKEFDDILAYVKKKGREARECHSNAGRKSFGSRTMLKVLVLKHLYNLSFEQVEYQLKDRLSFMRFVGVGLNGTVPDENTVRNYFEQYKETGAWDKLIRTFDKILEKAGYKAQEGSIVDASIVEAPRQRARQQRIRQARQGRQERSDVCPARVAGGPPGQIPGGNAREPGSKRPVERLSYESIDIKMPE